MIQKKQNALVLCALIIVTLMLTTRSSFAQADSHSGRIEKLEERVRNLEARMAKVEELSHKKMGMMPGGHGMGMPGQQQNMDDDMDGPMGQQPQQVPQQNPMPQGGGAMPGGAMGDM